MTSPCRCCCCSFKLSHISPSQGHDDSSQTLPVLSCWPQWYQRWARVARWQKWSLRWSCSCRCRFQFPGRTGECSRIWWWERRRPALSWSGWNNRERKTIFWTIKPTKYLWTGELNVLPFHQSNDGKQLLAWLASGKYLIVPAWRQESHSELLEGRKHQQLSLETADSQWVEFPLQWYAAGSKKKRDTDDVR